uniref:NADH dehydrogenase n=1 Tax=Pseudodiaptomus poplesia TaxID=213370 RepID=A0A0U2V8W9_9MAXI|nr:NADH dehydrogenase [Pseudodiaptomus poplesia]
MSSLTRGFVKLTRRSGAINSCCRLSLSPACNDVPTHTGQTFDNNDPRNVRFDVTGLKKQTNTQWAIDLIASVPPKKVSKRIVACDGGGGALGHPKVFINLDQEGPHSCIYCGLRFQHDHAHH